MTNLFDGGIFGSPDAKDDILSRELARQNIVQPGLFLGDSRYDHVVASSAGLDFIFVSQWSEFSDWRNYCAAHSLPVLGSLLELVN